VGNGYISFANIGIYRMAKKTSKKKTDREHSNKKKIQGSLLVKAGILIAAAVIVFLVFFNTCDDDNNMTYHTFKKEGELTFTDSLNNELTKIDIEIADNDYERQLGLMNRKSMEENQGMLFIFPVERYQSFWMLNTLFSLDMIFINKNKEIVTIHKNTTPVSQQSYPSSKPAIYVLEVVAGFTDKFNVKVGDKIFWIGSSVRLHSP
jgi:uncharacterized membrane protein (UPF0127 family)